MLTIAEMLGDADLFARTQELIARREAETEAQLAPFRARLKGKRVLLVYRWCEIVVGGRGTARSRHGSGGNRHT